jgi:hypothetical protein
MTVTDARNGFLNRFLIIETTRAHELALPPVIPNAIREQLGARVSAAIKAARKLGEVKLTAAAEECFAASYRSLTQENPTVIGAILSRGPAHVRRLALLYALARQSGVVDVVDVESALAFWRVCAKSVESIFGTETGDAIADRILRQMPKSSEFTLTMLRRKVLGTGNIQRDRLHHAIDALIEAYPDEFALSEQKTPGRSRTILSRL